ncbi:MAG: hypothetical protein AAF514_24400 [Verrucomicrobiota bacterium]
MRKKDRLKLKEQQRAEMVMMNQIIRMLPDMVNDLFTDNDWGAVSTQSRNRLRAAGYSEEQARTFIAYVLLSELIMSKPSFGVYDGEVAMDYTIDPQRFPILLERLPTLPDGMDRMGIQLNPADYVPRPEEAPKENEKVEEGH